MGLCVVLNPQYWFIRVEKTNTADLSRLLNAPNSQDFLSKSFKVNDIYVKKVLSKNVLEIIYNYLKMY